MFCFTAPMNMIPMIFVPREKVPILEKQPTGISLRLGNTRYPEFGLWHQCQDRGSHMFFPKCTKAEKYPKPVASVAVKRRCQLCRHSKMWHSFCTVAVFGTDPHALLDMKTHIVLSLQTLTHTRGWWLW